MTRMWMGLPSTMCRCHLLGEHKEIHQLLGQLKKKLSIKGYIINNCIEVSSIKRRHDELVEEMVRRGYNHKSPIPEQIEIEGYYEYLSNEDKNFKIDVASSDNDRFKRCSRCLEQKEKLDKVI